MKYLNEIAKKLFEVKVKRGETTLDINISMPDDKLSLITKGFRKTEDHYSFVRENKINEDYPRSGFKRPLSESQQTIQLAYKEEKEATQEQIAQRIVENIVKDNYEMLFERYFLEVKKGTYLAKLQKTEGSYDWYEEDEFYRLLERSSREENKGKIQIDDLSVKDIPTLGNGYVLEITNTEFVVSEDITISKR